MPVRAATDACTDVDVCIFFVGSSMIAVHEEAGPRGGYSMWSATNEGEGFDRSHLKLPGSQEEIIKVASGSLTYPAYPWVMGACLSSCMPPVMCACVLSCIPLGCLCMAVVMHTPL